MYSYIVIVIVIIDIVKLKTIFSITFIIRIIIIVIEIVIIVVIVVVIKVMVPAVNGSLLTQVVPALHHLGDVDLGGSRRDLHNLVIAHFGQTVLEQARYELTGTVIPSTHTTLIRSLLRTQEIITAGAISPSS